MNTWKKETTIEKLKMDLNNTILVYDSNVIVTHEGYDNSRKANIHTCAIYDFATEAHDIESPIVLVKSYPETFSDNGHAIAWGLSKLPDLYDDPIELLMNYTNPFENYTIEEMEKFFSQSVADGWVFPATFTALDLLEIYNDMDNIEEE